jgi:hypothetical protein
MQTPLRRSLPLAPAAVKGRPLEDEVRPLDRAWRPTLCGVGGHPRV